MGLAGKNFGHNDAVVNADTRYAARDQGRHHGRASTFISLMPVSAQSMCLIG
jgi:hypothetical protein